MALFGGFADTLRKQGAAPPAPISSGHFAGFADNIRKSDAAQAPARLKALQVKQQQVQKKRQDEINKKKAPEPKKNTLGYITKGAPEVLNAAKDFGVGLLQGMASAPERLVRSAVIEPGVTALANINGLKVPRDKYGNVDVSQQGKTSTIAGIKGTEGVANVIYGKAPVQTYQRSAAEAEKAASASKNKTIKGAAKFAPFLQPVLAAGDASIAGGGSKIASKALSPQTALESVVRTAKSTPKATSGVKSMAQETSRGGSIVAVPVKGAPGFDKALPTTNRPAGALQKAIEDARNAGDKKLATKLEKQLPDQAIDPDAGLSQAAKNKLSTQLSASTKPAKLPEFNVEKTSNLDKASRSTRSIIERSGEHGKKLADMLRGQRDNQQLFLSDLQKQMPTVTKIARGKAIGKDSISNESFENFIHATQGLEEAKTPQVAKAVEEWQAVHPQIRDRAVAAGLDVGDLGKNYYPHFINYDEVFKNNSTFNKAINHLVSTGQAKTNEDAIKLLHHAKDVSRSRSFGNLEASRLVDLPEYDKTPNSLVSYLNGSAKRITNTETFGAKDEKALELIAKAGAKGHDTEAIKNAYDVAAGAKVYNPTTSKISGSIRKYVTTTRLGLGALTNIQQNVNTGIVTGHLRTLGAALKQFSPKVRAQVAGTGVISDALLNDLKSQVGYSSFSQKVLGKTLNKITAPGFGAVEKFNRSVAATAGRDYALRLAQRGKVNDLRKLGVTGEIKGKTLTEAQQIQAARKVVEKTQFLVDPQDLPGWMDSPGGKLVAQFRTFSYNQSKFVSNEILKPAAKGNVVPLARLLAALPVGYAIYEGKRVIGGRPEETDPTKKGLAAFQSVGGAGLAFDIYQSLNPPGSKYIPSDRRVSMATGTAFGPAAGVAVQGVGAGSDLIQRKDTPTDKSKLSDKVAIANTGGQYTDATSAARFGLSQVPVVGTPIKNRFLPYTDPNAPKGTKLEQAITKVSQKPPNTKRTEKLKAAFSPEDYKLGQLSKKQQEMLVKQKIVSKQHVEKIRQQMRDKKKKLGYYKN